MERTDKTTLGAPLTPDEIRDIDRAVAVLKLATAAIADDTPAATLLGISTQVIDLAFRLRAEIEQAFIKANRRNLYPVKDTWSTGHREGLPPKRSTKETYTQEEIDMALALLGLRKETPDAS